ncbi:YbbR-like domain-containing protein [Criblamydia sequanensis]|uniref:Uncharacterized protein n=1 Tax=Candidatus Criblamydia sequanensis CRIB-18 TaxID=1437425 RepID=A0A090D1N6_9BACT|nr:hypothetical protein [Criblamydia sequanensis]CDR33940.1 Conserved hypothetical protein [Criblamydia sequanensis CRIB-18]
MSGFFLRNWQRKLLSFITAIVLWLYVNHSITDTKTIPNVPIKIINLPSDKTIAGLLPNGMLKKRISLILSGSREVIQELEPGDLEVVIDASSIDHDSWIARIGKKNLVSLNPAIDLAHHITQVQHNDFVINLTPIMTADVPIRIMVNSQNAPEGYEFLDVWPETLFQTLTGPAEEIQRLKLKGLKLVLDLNKITKQDLDGLTLVQKNQGKDEVSFLIPPEWKKVMIGFRNNVLEEINDPEAEFLQVEFLKKDALALEKDLPLRVFYPLEYSNLINPSTYSLVKSAKVDIVNDLPLLTVPLYVKDVSRQFLEVIRNYLEVVLIASPRTERDVLEWSSGLVDPKALENTYVAFMLSNSARQNFQPPSLSKKREQLLRNRFKRYRDRLTLWSTPTQRLNLEPVLGDHEIIVK